MKAIFLILALFLACRSLARDSSLFFKENAGQVKDQFHNSRSDIDFSINASGLNIFIKSGAIEYIFVQSQKRTGVQIFKTYRLGLELLNANKNIIPVKEDQLQYSERYYQPHLNTQSALIHTFSRIRYPEIYPHIDWLLYINNGKLEYEFVVKEGGDPNDIQLKYYGANSIEVDASGNLLVKTPYGKITEHKPISFQEDGNEITSAFSINNDVVSFDIDAYKGTLLIDPYVQWATYNGGGSYDWFHDIDKDASGNVYVSGFTTSVNQMASIGAHDVTYADSGDAYIAKFDSDGNRLWATYYGGNSMDIFLGIAYDYHGYIYVTGSTNNATGIATVGSEQPVFAGPNSGLPYVGGDAIIIKFDSLGNRIWGTYFGGAGRDSGSELACDNLGNVYVTGITASASAITTSGVHQQIYGGNSDVFLAKYDSAGTKIWSTYYGGSDYDGSCDVFVTTGNSIYVCGNTSSTSSIATSGVYQTTKPPGMCSFIAAFDNNGGMDWGTYFGGNSGTGSTTLQTLYANSSGDIFAAGYTDDASGLTTNGCHQSIYGGSGAANYGDGIVTRFDNTGNRVWSTYFGGSNDEFIKSIALSDYGEIFITGFTFSSNNIAINAYQGNFGGGGPADADGWIAKMDDAGVCLWSTYWGGDKDDKLSGILCSDQDVYISGWGESMPVTPLAHQTSNGGGSDGYILKLKEFPSQANEYYQQKDKLVLFPNPNDGNLYIEGYIHSTNGLLQVTVYNILGEKVYSKSYQNINESFNLEINLNKTLPSGIYTIDILNGSSMMSNRFIKE